VIFRDFLYQLHQTRFSLFLRSSVDFCSDIAARFGGDCTASAIDNRFRRIKKDAKLINDAIAKGIDPMTLDIGDTSGEVAMRSVKRGPGQTKSSQFSALCIFSFHSRAHTARNILKKSLLIFDAEVSRCFGSDATPSAILNVWKRQVRPAAKSITDTLNQGGDPKDLALVESLWTSTKGSTGRSFEISYFFAQRVFLPSANEWSI
jgi:hypothetical protein